MGNRRTCSALHVCWNRNNNKNNNKNNEKYFHFCNFDFDSINVLHELNVIFFINDPNSKCDFWRYKTTIASAVAAEYQRKKIQIRMGIKWNNITSGEIWNRKSFTTYLRSDDVDGARIDVTICAKMYSENKHQWLVCAKVLQFRPHFSIKSLSASLIHSTLPLTRIPIHQ